MKDNYPKVIGHLYTYINYPELIRLQADDKYHEYHDNTIKKYQK